MPRRLFTSESVTEGHPDKIADQISDSVLDALLEQDPHSRVAVETLLTTGLVVVAGEVTTSGYVDIKQKVRDRILETLAHQVESGRKLAPFLDRLENGRLLAAHLLHGHLEAPLRRTRPPSAQPPGRAGPGTTSPRCPRRSRR